MKIESLIQKSKDEDLYKIRSMLIHESWRKIQQQKINKNKKLGFAMLQTTNNKVYAILLL